MQQELIEMLIAAHEELEIAGPEDLKRVTVSYATRTHGNAHSST